MPHEKMAELKIKPVKMVFIPNADWKRMESKIKKDYKEISNYIRRK